MMRIRAATSQDIDEIRNIHLRAFSEGEQRKIAALAVNLLHAETTPETISLLAEVDGAAVGHTAFSPVAIAENKNWIGYILAPLAVKPEYQKQQIGSKLIASGLERLSQLGAHRVFVYGDPSYYSRFGFTTEAASRYVPPYALQYPFGWQAIVLDEDSLVADAVVPISCAAPLHDPELW
jgi:putative acetyltransferase